MYDYISGTVAELNPTDLVLDNNGIGYHFLISLQTYTQLQGKTSAKVYVYHHLREDEEQFYGFYDKAERDVFMYLISVSGIGPNTARMMLSSLSTDEVRTALATGDVNRIKSVKGIGIKTAQRAIIELKDKIGKTASEGEIALAQLNNSPVREEAAAALVMLGFAKANVEKAVAKIIKEDPGASLEDIIKRGLKIL